MLEITRKNLENNATLTPEQAHAYYCQRDDTGDVVWEGPAPWRKVILYHYGDNTCISHDSDPLLHTRMLAEYFGSATVSDETAWMADFDLLAPIDRSTGDFAIDYDNILNTLHTLESLAANNAATN